MTNDQYNYEIYKFQLFVEELIAEELPQITMSECLTRIESKFDKFGIGMGDVLHLLAGDWNICRHANPVGGVQFELHGHSVDGDQLVIVVSRSGDKLKLSNVWVKPR